MQDSVHFNLEHRRKEFPYSSFDVRIGSRSVPYTFRPAPGACHMGQRKVMSELKPSATLGGGR